MSSSKYKYLVDFKNPYDFLLKSPRNGENYVKQFINLLELKSQKNVLFNKGFCVNRYVTASPKT